MIFFLLKSGAADSYLLWTLPYLTHSWFIRNQLLFLFYTPPGTQLCLLLSAVHLTAADIHRFLCPDFFFSGETICLASLYSIYQTPCGWNTDLGKPCLASRDESQGQLYKEMDFSHVIIH